jgi:hypothetical protein
MSTSGAGDGDGDGDGDGEGDGDGDGEGLGKRVTLAGPLAIQSVASFASVVQEALHVAQSNTKAMSSRPSPYLVGGEGVQRDGRRGRGRSLAFRTSSAAAPAAARAVIAAAPAHLTVTPTTPVRLAGGWASVRMGVDVQFGDIPVNPKSLAAMPQVVWGWSIRPGVLREGRRLLT